MHPFVIISGKIQASRPLKATSLAALVLFAVTATAALPLLSAPGMNGSSCEADGPSQPPPTPPTAKPPAPENFKITGIWESTCEVEFEWTQSNPDNVTIDRYQYRTRKANDGARVWNSWTEIGRRELDPKSQSHRKRGEACSRFGPLFVKKATTTATRANL